MQRVINYGSFLQAYALRRTIERLGHETAYVDIKKGQQLILSANEKSSGKTIKVTELPKRIDHVLFKKHREKLFREKLFVEHGINTPKEETELDMLVVGSDEVFNCLQKSPWGLSLQLMGDTTIPAISYAASCGYTTLEKLNEIGVTDKVANALRKYKTISVRDLNSANVVREISGVKPQIHLDPVLIYNWNTEISKEECSFKNYILVYGYDNRINNAEEISAIKSFAKKHGKKLISFGVYQRWCDRNVLCNPFQLINYFMNADYVITDTFHGTVLSIKCNRQFATIIRESNKNKITDLLSRFKLDGRAVEIDRLESILQTPIDFSNVNATIDAERKRTIEYLDTNIK